MKLVYILAASHSGSTLLAMLLNAHPEVCSVGELKATSLGDADRYRCSCGEIIRRCPFWLGVSARMAGLGLAFDVTAAGTHYQDVPSACVRRLLRPLHRGPVLERLRDAALWLSPAWRRRLPVLHRRNAALAQTVLELTGKRVLVDSSKVGLRLKYLLRNPGLDVRVVRLVRDGRAVALTYTDPAAYADASDPALRGGGSGGDRRFERLTMARAAREWRRSNEEAECILSRLDRSRWIELRYEALCADPSAELARVFDWLGVDAARWDPDFRRAEHHVVGNGMRLDIGSDIRLDDRWRESIPPATLHLFDSVAGRKNRLHGYA